MQSTAQAVRRLEKGDTSHEGAKKTREFGYPKSKSPPCLAKNREARMGHPGVLRPQFSTFPRPPFQFPGHLRIEIEVGLIFGRTMNVIRKTLFLLGVAALLLCVPLSAAAEDDDVLSSPTVNSAIAPPAVSPRARGTARAQMAGTVVAAPRTVRLSSVSEHGSNFVLPDGRSHLRSFCLLRC